MSEPVPFSDLATRIGTWAQQTYRWHLTIFVGFNVLLTAINLWTGKPWWALWPLVITGGLFLVHFLIYKTSMVDDAWVEERADEIYGRSYDTGHINSIAERHDMETVAQKRERERQERAEQEKREYIREIRAARKRQQQEPSDERNPQEKE